jgi:hypothetical protein
MPCSLGRSEAIAPTIHNLDAVWRVAVHLTPQPFCSQGSVPAPYPLNSKLGGPQSGLDTTTAGPTHSALWRNEVYYCGNCTGICPPMCHELTGFA